MKKMIMMMSFMMFLTVLASAQTVGTDRELDADIHSYKTFTWASDIDNIPSDKIFVGPNGVMVFNNESTRSKIKESIQYELTARGYKMANNNADFIVNYMILEQPTNLITYTGYETVSIGMDTVRTEDNVERISVKEGTLLIKFIDRESSKEVWQGYASGILKPDMMNDDSKIKNAVSSIFADYKFSAN